MFKQFSTAIRITLLMTVLTGLLYPSLVTGIAKLAFPHQASGSLIVENGKVIGSELIGQDFTKPEYFHPRPSAAGEKGYDAVASGGSNLGPTNPKLVDRVKLSIAKFRAENPEFQGPIPADALTTSASGLDPEISPASAEAQSGRVANVRGIPADEVRKLIVAQTAGRDLGFLGEPRVNVLRLNLSLDKNFPRGK
jgi:potassium-transporting ATPase KdpC subunit